MTFFNLEGFKIPIDLEGKTGFKPQCDQMLVEI